MNTKELFKTILMGHRTCTASLRFIVLYLSALCRYVFFYKLKIECLWQSYIVRWLAIFSKKRAFFKFKVCVLFFSPSWIMTLSRQRGLHYSMKLGAMSCRVTQDGWVIVRVLTKCGPLCIGTWNVRFIVVVQSLCCVQLLRPHELYHSRLPKLTGHGQAGDGKMEWISTS